MVADYLSGMQQGQSRGNCLVFAMLFRLAYRDVRLRFRRSPDFPLLPRVSYSVDGGRTWFRFMHRTPPAKGGWRKWLPVHAVWFRGVVRRDIA